MTDSPELTLIDSETSQWTLLPPGETSLGYLTRGDIWVHYDHLPILFDAYAGNTPGGANKVFVGTLVDEPDGPDGRVTVYLLAETGRSMIEGAQSGDIPLRDMFVQSNSCVLLRITFDGQACGWEIEPAPSPLPESMLHRPGVRFGRRS